MADTGLRCPTVEHAIELADLLPPTPSPDAIAAMSLVQRLELRRRESDRMDVRRAVVAARLQRDGSGQLRYVNDALCGESFTVLGYIAHTALVQHEAGEVTAQEPEVDERDRGRGGESRSAAHA